ncbi:MAG: membrane integrity-associated transporter subunit PqiC [Mailhella sp.]|nr:membrane integrity-associated transporter subunit PqiC [Mailhella sp.]
MKRFAALAASLLLMLAGCAPQGGPVRYYVLSSGQMPASAPVRADRAVAVAVLDIPQYLNRQQIVMRDADGVEMRIDNSVRWGENLRSGITNALCADLTARLAPGGCAVPAAPGNSAGRRVLVEIRKFEGVPGGSSVLSAIWSVSDKNDTFERRSFTASLPSGDTEGALVRSLSMLLDEFTAAIADEITRE